MQILDTGRDITLFGFANNMDKSGLGKWLEKLLEAGRRKMITKYARKFSRAVYDKPIPAFEVIKDFVPNAPFQPRDKNDTFPN